MTENQIDQNPTSSLDHVDPLALLIVNEFRKTTRNVWLGFPPPEEKERLRAEKEDRHFQEERRRADAKDRRYERLMDRAREAGRRNREV